MWNDWHNLSMSSSVASRLFRYMSAENPQERIQDIPLDDVAGAGHGSNCFLPYSRRFDRLHQHWSLRQSTVRPLAVCRIVTDWSLENQSQSRIGSC
jgi:hypothetical protein